MVKSPARSILSIGTGPAEAPSGDSDEDPPEEPPLASLALELAGGASRLVTLADRERLEPYFHAFSPNIQDYSFAINLAWYAHQGLCFRFIAGCLCLFRVEHGLLSMPLPPLGPREAVPRALMLCFAALRDANGVLAERSVQCVHGDVIEALRTAPVAPPVRVEMGWPDYLYRTESLRALRGAAYKAKRNDINQFLRAHPGATLTPLGSGDLPEVLALCRGWLQHLQERRPEDQDTEALRFAWHELRAIRFALRHLDALGLVGLRLDDGGRLLGFTIGERLRPGVASVLFEKTDLSVKGAAQYLFREFCETFADCELVTTGDGVGQESLDRCKQSYQPIALSDKATLYDAEDAA